MGKHVILTSVVLSQYTRITDRRQTTYYDNSRTLQCELQRSLKKLQAHVDTVAIDFHTGLGSRVVK